MPLRTLSAPVLTVALAFAPLAVAAAPDTTATPVPRSQWLEVVDGAALPEGGVAAWYRKLRLEGWNLDERELRRYTSSDAFRFTPLFNRFHVKEGSLAGEWMFHARDGERWPTQAVRTTFPTGPAYRVRVELHCEDDIGLCEALRTQTQAMLSPEPPAPPHAGAEALAQWSEALKRWREVYLYEQCSEGPAQMPAPKYPPAAARQGVDGRVSLIVQTNPCGQVREAMIETSSRSRELDRSARDASLKWRVEVPADARAAKKGVTLRIPIDFELPEPEMPPAGDTGAGPAGG